MNFRWNDWNRAKVAKHGITPTEAEQVVRSASKPWPRFERGKWLVWGQSDGGRHLQAVFILDPDDTVFIIHARPLTTKERSAFRRRR
jgi:uncharacterized DUF497 family protein